MSDKGGLIFSSNPASNTIGVFAPGPTRRFASSTSAGTQWPRLRSRAGRSCWRRCRRPGDARLAHSVDDRPCPWRATQRARHAQAHALDRVRSGPELFYVNIAQPAEIVVVDPRQPDTIARSFSVPHAGPHGLDLDGATGRLFCACDAGVLVTLDARSGKVLDEKPLERRARRRVLQSPAPASLCCHRGPRRHRRVCHLAHGKLATIETKAGAHTTALSPTGDRLYAFLPRTHRAAIYET